MFQAPSGEPQLCVCLLGRAHAAVEVFTEEGLGFRVGLDFVLDLFGLFQFALERDQAHEALHQHILGVETGGDGQMLDSLGREAVRFAPECELNMGGGVLAGFGTGHFVSSTISRGRLGGFAAVAEHGTAEQECVEHGFLTTALGSELDCGDDVTLVLLRRVWSGGRTARRRELRS